MQKEHSYPPPFIRFPICLFLWVVWVVLSIFGLDLPHGYANPKIGSEFGQLPNSLQSMSGANFFQKRKVDTLSFPYDLDTLEPQTHLKQTRNDTEHISVPIYHSPDHSQKQFARPVRYHQSSVLSLFTVDLYFDTDRVELGDDLTHSIEKSVEHPAAIRNNPMSVEAFCDQRGGVGYSLSLGARRLHLVKQYLLDLGISHQVIEVVNFGSSGPPCRGLTHRCENIRLQIQSTFKFFAIQQPKFGCVVRITFPDNLTPPEKVGPSPQSLLPYHTRLAPLHRNK